MSDEPVYVGGHSLGGACTYEYAYSRLKRGLRLDGIFVFAPAKPGDGAIGKLFKETEQNFTVFAIHNLGDPISDVPIDMPLAGQYYEQPCAFTIISEAPPPGSDIVFGRHKIALYQAGTRKLGQGNGPILLSQACDAVAQLYNDSTAGWDWINPVDGLYWAMIRINGARLMIRRGSHTKRDWFREDFNALETEYMGARMSRGFVDGWLPLCSELDAQLA